MILIYGYAFYTTIYIIREWIIVSDQLRRYIVILLFTSAFKCLVAAATTVAAATRIFPALTVMSKAVSMPDLIDSELILLFFAMCKYDLIGYWSFKFSIVKVI